MLLFSGFGEVVKKYRRNVYSSVSVVKPAIFMALVIESSMVFCWALPAICFQYISTMIQMTWVNWKLTKTRAAKSSLEHSVMESLFVELCE